MRPSFLLLFFISIHVPTRGTTSETEISTSLVIISIHVPTRGTTSYTSINDADELKFQSTFPQGERPYVTVPVAYPLPISIHVPTRGTTIEAAYEELVSEISIHVPTRGTTTRRNTGYTRIRYFNPRSHKGNDCVQIRKWTHK